jgi:hypothetical protein
MFGSAILDVGIGLVFAFLAVSLISSAIAEAINSLFKIRSSSLLSGIKDLVNDSELRGLARVLYGHAAINPRGSLAPLPPAPAAPAAAPVAPAAAPAAAPNATPAHVLSAARAAAGAAVARAAAPGPVAQGWSWQWARGKAVQIWRGGAGPARLPAYISKLQFANALLDVTGLSAASSAASSAAAPAAPGPDAAPGPNAARDLKAALAAGLATIGQVDPQVQQLLEGIIDRANGDIKEVRSEVADWFDNAMDRVGGAFKRWAQLLTFVIALFVSALVNVDTIHLAASLWSHPELVDQLKIPDNVKPDLFAAKPPDIASWAAAATKMNDTLDETLPLGWPPRKPWGSGFTWESVLGWLVTAFATLFGAPFWFDTLQGFVRLKGAGPSPQEKADKTAASA